MFSRNLTRLWHGWDINPPEFDIIRRPNIYIVDKSVSIVDKSVSIVDKSVGIVDKSVSIIDKSVSIVGFYIPIK